MRSLYNDFLVDNTPMLDPDEGIEISFSDLDSEDSGRDESGFMHRTVVREKVKTWSFSYAILTAEDYAYIKALFAGKATFQVSYTDETGNACNTTAYCSKSSITVHNPRTGVYKNLKFNIIEC